MQPRYNAAKFAELVMYFAERFADDPKFAQMKLSKLLFLADTEAFRQLGQPIAGETYKRERWGLLAYHARGAQKDLQHAGRLRLDQRRRGFMQLVPVAIDRPDTSVFIADELRIVDAAAELLAEHGGRDVSHWSHCESVGMAHHAAW
jgi:hypothetical protein